MSTEDHPTFNRQCSACIHRHWPGWLRPGADLRRLGLAGGRVRRLRIAPSAGAVPRRRHCCMTGAAERACARAWLCASASPANARRRRRPRARRTDRTRRSAVHRQTKPITAAMSRRTAATAAAATRQRYSGRGRAGRTLWSHSTATQACVDQTGVPIRRAAVIGAGGRAALRVVRALSRRRRRGPAGMGLPRPSRSAARSER